MEKQTEYETWSVDFEGEPMLCVHYDRARCQMWTNDDTKAKTISNGAFATIAWALREVGMKVTRISSYKL